MTLRAWGLFAVTSAGLACSDGAATSPDAATARDVSVSEAATDALSPSDAVTPTTRDLAYEAPPRSAVVETGVRREVFTVDTPAAPPNPNGNVATPAELNRVQVLRYRSDDPTPRAVRAVVVAVPGFLGGAGSFDPLARSLVRRGAMTGAPVEVWSIDRRSNLLEDLRGMDMASRMRDPEIAAHYYLGYDLTLGGRAFPGFRGPVEPGLSFMSEWGIATLVHDLRAVVDRVPMSRSHVVLLGHSLGASVVEAYAAWDFAGTPGYRTIAGLAVVDGVASGTAATEAAWRTTGAGGAGGFGSANVTQIRQSGPWFTALPVLGVKALAVSEIVARRAALTPDAIVRDADRDMLFQVLLGVSDVPPMTNAAAMGFAFDDRSCPLAFARMSVGSPTGGAVRMAPGIFDPTEMLTVPASATDTYRWTDALGTTPREFTPVANAAAAWSATPSNFSEWYFPTRLSLDIAALGDMSLAMDAWQVREGIRVTHGREIDVPVLGIATALVGRADAFDRMRMRIAPAIGVDLPGAGATRTSPMGFRAIFVPGQTHIDPLTAADGNADNPVPEAMDAFVRGATTGTVTPNP